MEKVSKIPSAIQNYVKALQDRLGKGFTVNVNQAPDGSYTVTVSRTVDLSIGVPMGANQLWEGFPSRFALQSISFSISEDASTIKILSATFTRVNLWPSGSVTISGTLLEGIMGNLADPVRIAFEPIGATQRIVDFMSELTLTKGASDEAYFEFRGVSYHAFMKDGTVVVEKVSKIPAVLQDFIKSLEARFGNRFKFAAKQSEDRAKWIITIELGNIRLDIPQPQVAFPGIAYIQGSFMGGELSFNAADGSYEVLSASFAGLGKLSDKQLALLKTGLDSVDQRLDVMYDPLRKLETLSKVQIAGANVGISQRDVTGQGIAPMLDVV